MRATVVGAGIGGLTTALGLHRAGWSITVLERWPEVVGIGAALGVWPTAAEALDRLGLGEAIRRDSVPIVAAAIFRKDGRALLRVPENSPRIPPVRLISRRTLMDRLLESAGGVEIRTGVAADEAQLRAALSDSDVLIGADGLRSGVRTAFFDNRTKPRYSGLLGVRGFVEFESGAYGETWADGTIFGNTPMAGGRTNFYAAVPAPADARPDLPDLRDRFADWREPIPKILAAAREHDVLCNPIFDLHPPLRSFVAGRVALLGDAAHAMTPHAGRGACEAILDADRLVAHLITDRDVDVALAGYDRERRRPAQRSAVRSWRVGRLSHTRRGAGLRNGLLRAVSLVAR